jgi:uncharacterized repeat protein (TIGR01451 family)
VTGYGFPPSTSPYFAGGVRNAYIEDASGTIIWNGSITTDGNGSVSNQATSTITGSYTGGTARLFVEHPSESPSSYYPYDSFTIAAPPSNNADLQVTKSVSADSVYEGNSIIYTINISNVGGADGNITTIADTLPLGLTYIPGSSSSLTAADPTVSGNILTWSGSWNIENYFDQANTVTLAFRVALDAAAGDNMSYPNRAGVTYDGSKSSATGETAHVKFLPPPSAGPNIIVEKYASVDTIINGANFQYTIKITNTGDTAGNLSTVVDTLPTGFSYVAGTSSGITMVDPVISGQTITWGGVWVVNEAGVMPNYQSLTFTVTAPRTIGDYTNIATVTGSNFSTVSSGPSAPVHVIETPSAPNMSLTKIASADTVRSGDNLSYTINILNNGGSRGAIVAIVDSLPVGFSYVPGSTSGMISTDPTILGRRLSWSGNWNINKNVTLSLTFSAKSAIASDLFFNKAEVFGTNFEDASSGWTSPVRVLSPELTLTKTVDVVNALPGDTLTYTVTYMNIGDDEATEVIVYERIPPNVSYIVDSAIGTGMIINYSVNNGSSYDAAQSEAVTNIRFERGTNLPLGEMGTIEFKVWVPD